MKSLVEHLTVYATYHRDRRNIATHFFGIPMIVVGIAGLLSRPAFGVGELTLAPVHLVMLGSIVFYMLLDVRYGLAMTVFMGGNLYAATLMAEASTAWWLTLSLGSFTAGWAIQFLGHMFEGKKPAFLDDLVGLLIGPLFIVAEAGFFLGLGNSIRTQIEKKAGPTRARSPEISEVVSAQS
jgi:uncharacterized membrane protein YGL010W